MKRRLTALPLVLALGCGAENKDSGAPGPDGSAGAGGGASRDASPLDEHLDPQRIAFQRIPLHNEFYSEGAAATDVDGDGHLDVVTGPFWYAGPDFVTRHVIYPAVVFDVKGYSDNFFAFPYDLNSDGFTDILYVGFPGTDATWYENPRSIDGTWARHTVFNGVDDESPTFVDITGDHLPELVCAHGGQLGWVAPRWDDPASAWTFHPLSPPRGFGAFTHGLGVGDSTATASSTSSRQPAFGNNPQISRATPSGNTTPRRWDTAEAKCSLPW